MFGIDLVIPDITYLIKNRERVTGIFLTHGHEDHIGALPYVLKQLNVPVYGTKLTLGIVETKLKEHGLLSTTELIRVKPRDVIRLNSVSVEPVYGTKLTLGIVETKLKEHGLLSTTELIRVKPRDVIRLNSVSVEFIKTNHSIADSVAIAIHTPLGVVLHTGDFKVDYTPIDGEPMDFARFSELGKKGVLVMMADSTNVERPGYTMSERVVGESLVKIFGKAKGRIIIATFASNIHRIQQIIEAGKIYGRKVAVSGRSMENNMQVAMELGYIDVDKETLIGIDHINKYNDDELVVITTGSQGEPMSALSRMASSDHRKVNIKQGDTVIISAINKYNDDELVVITTGSQGEPMSALSRMASSDHRKVNIKQGDTVIISATPIPGNEKLVSRVINQLFKNGAEVIYESLAQIHVSGHAYQEELKLMQALVKPKFFIPVHGEYRHLKKHGELAMTVGLPEENLVIADLVM